MDRADHLNSAWREQEGRHGAFWAEDGTSRYSKGPKEGSMGTVSGHIGKLLTGTGHAHGV